MVCYGIVNFGEPHMKRLFCSECGSQYASLDWPRVCNNCNHIAWNNPVPVATILQPVTDGDREGLLVLKRAIQPHLGGWSLPGGFMENNGESAEEGALRELFEETGLQPPTIPKIVSSTATSNGQLLIVSESTSKLSIASIDKIVLCSENSDYRVAWEPEELAFPIHRKAMKDWFERRSQLERHV